MKSDWVERLYTSLWGLGDRMVVRHTVLFLCWNVLGSLRQVLHFPRPTRSSEHFSLDVSHLYQLKHGWQRSAGLPPPSRRFHCFKTVGTLAWHFPFRERAPFSKSLLGLCTSLTTAFMIQVPPNVKWFSISMISIISLTAAVFSPKTSKDSSLPFYPPSSVQSVLRSPPSSNPFSGLR